MRRARRCWAWRRPICACPTPAPPTPSSATSSALGDWRAHLGAAGSVLVNSATLGLIIAQSLTEASAGGATLRGLVSRLGEPAIRAGVASAMQRMGEAFVLGRDIGEALRRADRGANRAFRYSFDMLGEGARTAPGRGAPTSSPTATRSRPIGAAAERRGRRLHPRQRLGEAVGPASALRAVPGRSRRPRTHRRASSSWPAWPRTGGVGLTVDAEEAERLETVAVDHRGRRARSLAGWLGRPRHGGPGLSAARAGGDRLGRRPWRRPPGGGSWCGWSRAPTGTPRSSAAQERGLADYPVFTRKSAHRRLLHGLRPRAAGPAQRLFPAFATHNALTVATVLEWAGASVATSSSSACTAWARASTRT